MEYRILSDACIGCSWCMAKGQPNSVPISGYDHQKNRTEIQSFIQNIFHEKMVADYCPVGAIVPSGKNGEWVSTDNNRNYLPPAPSSVGLTHWGSGNRTLQLYCDYDYLLGSEILETLRIKSEKDPAETENRIIHFAEINSNPLPALKHTEGLFIVDFNLCNTGYANSLGKIFSSNRVLISSIRYSKAFPGKQNKVEKPERTYEPGKLNQAPDEKDLAIITFSW